VDRRGGAGGEGGGRGALTARALTLPPGLWHVIERAALDFAGLGPRERLDLIGEFGDGLSPAQDAELARRMTTFDADAETAVAWPKV
jgi:hypothetical protein